MTRSNHLRIVEPSPWNRAEAYRPDPVEMLRASASKRPSYAAQLAADFREVVSEIREHPISHVLVAILTVVAWTAVLVVPLLIGAAK